MVNTIELQGNLLIIHFAKPKNCKFCSFCIFKTQERQYNLNELVKMLKTIKTKPATIEFRICDINILENFNDIYEAILKLFPKSKIIIHTFGLSTNIFELRKIEEIVFNLYDATSTLFKLDTIKMHIDICIRKKIKFSFLFYIQEKMTVEGIVEFYKYLRKAKSIYLVPVDERKCKNVEKFLRSCNIPYSILPSTYVK